MDADRQNAEKLTPAALTVADLARLVGLPAEAVGKDVAEGAPRNADGTMNLVHYAAWLNQKAADAD